MAEQQRPDERISRRRTLKGLFYGAVGGTLALLLDGYFIEPQWVQTVHVKLPLAGLNPAFAGKRLVQISDLHYSDVVGEPFLVRCMDRVSALAPDIVVLTGDYITSRDSRYIKGVLKILEQISCPLGVYAVFGNHDYGIWSPDQQIVRHGLSEFLHGMAARNIHALYNSSAAITLSGQRLWMVGLGDLWANDCLPVQAFREVPPDEARIVLVHNPDAVDCLAGYRTDATLCGHTHGGQVRIPFYGAPVLPIRNRRHCAGLYETGNGLLYVNRGLGRLGGVRGRVRFNCRPEITVFTLQTRE